VPRLSAINCGGNDWARPRDFLRDRQTFYYDRLNYAPVGRYAEVLRTQAC